MAGGVVGFAVRERGTSATNTTRFGRLVPGQLRLDVGDHVGLVEHRAVGRGDSRDGLAEPLVVDADDQAVA